MIQGPRRHLVFDLDGTLIDSAPLCADIVNEMLAARGSGRSYSAEDVRPFMTRGGPQMLAALLGDVSDDLDADLIAFRRIYAAKRTPEAVLFPHVRAGLDRLHAAGFRSAICSNKADHLCRKIVDDLDLADLLPVVVGSRPDQPLKPDPALLTLALAGLDSTPETVLYIGDSAVDEATCRALDVPFLFVRYGYAEPEWVCGSDLCFDSFDALADHLLAEADALVA